MKYEKFTLRADSGWVIHDFSDSAGAVGFAQCFGPNREEFAAEVVQRWNSYQNLRDVCADSLRWLQNFAGEIQDDEMENVFKLIDKLQTAIKSEAAE